MRVYSHQQGVKLILPLSFIVAFLVAGCSSHNRDLAHEDLIRAGSILEAAEIAGGDTVAPREMFQARENLARAESLYKLEPKTGKLSGNIASKEQLSKLSSESSRHAIAAVRQALQELKEETGQASKEKILRIQQESEEKLAAIRQELEAEYNQRTQIDLEYLENVTVELELSRQETRLAQDQLENIRNSLLAGPSPLATSLANELGDDLYGWGAEFDQKNLTIRFVGPATGFKNASTWVNGSLQRILKDFFPRLLQVVSRPEYKNQIDKIKVKGFSSGIYQRAKSDKERHRLNFELSQERADNVVNFLLSRRALKSEWLKSHLVAVGMSDSDPVLNAAGVENYDKSRRIEIEIVLSGNIGG